jgi:hypothetical protein
MPGGVSAGFRSYVMPALKRGALAAGVFVFYRVMLIAQ